MLSSFSRARVAPSVAVLRRAFSAIPETMKVRPMNSVPVTDLLETG